MPTKKRVYAYCDGGCAGNPGVGGWGVLLIFDNGEQRELMESAPETTNNQMEITAAIEALNALDTLHDVTIVTDSQYLIGIMTMHWKRKANRELLAQLDKAIARHASVQWEWIRGHDGHDHNERAHTLAQAAIERRRDKLQQESCAAQDGKQEGKS